MAYSFDPTVRNLIYQTATRHNVDPLAALAVAMGEGGVKYGAVGDQGTSYGPFQLHVGGALPQGKGADWANSPAGIQYAIRKMAESGAAGLTGQEAIDAIVRKFERPANPDASVTNAMGRYSDPAFRASLLKGIQALETGAPIPGRPDVAPLMADSGVRAAALRGLQQIASGKYNPLQSLNDTMLEKQRAAAQYGGYTSADNVTAAPNNPQPSNPATGPAGGELPEPINADWAKLNGIGKMTPSFMQVAIKKAQDLGLRVGENPAVEPIDGNHVPGSFHYQTFQGQKLGRAIDISGDAAAMAAFFKWAIRYRPTELFYDPLGQYDNGRYSTKGIGNHSDHVHLSV